MMRLSFGLASLLAAASWSIVATAETGVKPEVGAPAREAPKGPDQRRPGNVEPPATEDEGAVPDWRGCPYFGRTLELIV